MTKKEIAAMVDAIGIPSAYRVFKEPQDLPYAIFIYEENDDIVADGTNYQEVVNLSLYLYTATKDFDLEAKTEGILNGAGLVFSKMEDYIDTEQMYQITYESEVIING